MLPEIRRDVESAFARNQYIDELFSPTCHPTPKIEFSWQSCLEEAKYLFDFLYCWVYMLTIIKTHSISAADESQTYKAKNIIERKVRHTADVIHYTLELVKRLKAKGKIPTEIPDEAFILMAIMHDISRSIEGWVNGQLSEQSKFDHASISAYILVFWNYATTTIIPYINRIFEAIMDHSRIKATSDDVFTHVLRDADKIAIAGTVEEILEDKSYDAVGFSPKVVADFQRGQPIDKKNVRSNQDYILLILAFYFDLHYEDSKSMFTEEKLHFELLHILRHEVETASETGLPHISSIEEDLIILNQIEGQVKEWNIES